MLELFFLIVQLSFAAFIFYLGLAFLTGAPFVRSKIKTAEVMIAFSHIKKKGAIVYDLGSGDGRLLFLAAKEGAYAIGLEINPFLVLLTKIRILFSPYRRRIRVRWKNFWHANISDADVIFFYLIPWRMDKLKDMLQKQLKPGTLIVSNSFIFPGWKILQQDSPTHVYVFKT